MTMTGKVLPPPTSSDMLEADIINMQHVKARQWLIRNLFAKMNVLSEWRAVGRIAELWNLSLPLLGKNKSEHIKTKLKFLHFIIIDSLYQALSPHSQQIVFIPLPPAIELHVALRRAQFPRINDAVLKMTPGKKK
mmetsp:Transcript_34692/g.53192  ORF Transcript_34692/g.53192 Transcript_34692/m.53192 type:complete len:135 (+) Transcript_34692:2135-2539(+)